MNLIDRFREFEQENSVFQIEIEGVPIWERLRFNTLREIKQQSGTGQPHTSIDLNRSDHIQGAKLWLRNMFVKNPYLASPSEVIFVGHPRRKKESNGYWWDIYCDPIQNSCSLDSVHFENPYLLGHQTPAKTESIRYLEFINYSGTIQRKLGLYDVTLSSDDVSRLEALEQSIRKQFDVDVQIVEEVQRLLRNRECRLWLYKRLLDRIDPKIAVVVVSYGKHMFIEACKDKEIPVVELQHGVIYPDHLGYSFAGERTKSLFPDYLLTWGEFWGNDVKFPIPDDRVIPVGYPYLEQSAHQYENTQSRDQILFISQGTIGERLSKFAMEVDRHPDIDHEIVYKLHPGEYDRWKDEYPWLLEADFEIVDRSEPPLYELFAESSVQIGVGSTAVYEGLCFELETYVYDGSSVLHPLVDEGSATVVSTADELALALGDGGRSFNRDYYFAPDATQRTCKTIRWLIEDGTVYNSVDL